MKTQIRNLFLAALIAICLLYAGCKSDSPVTGPPPGTPAGLVLQSRTVNAAETFTATNSITAGPSFTIANTGAATFVTRNGLFYFRPGFAVAGGGSLRTVRNPSLAKNRAH